MCGIAGVAMKPSCENNRIAGPALLDLLSALERRGPDSMGAALRIMDEESVFVTFTGGQYDLRTLEDEAKQLSLEGRFYGGAPGSVSVFQGKCGVDGDFSVMTHSLKKFLRDHCPGSSILSISRSVIMLKVLGGAALLNAAFGLRDLNSQMAIGHTRLATESQIDLVHSQPLTAPSSDVTIVHNGHITNYIQLRQRFEKRGYPFLSGNDSEVIAIYLADRLGDGATLQEALEASLVDLDGSYSILALTADSIGCVRDQFGFKPLMMAESDEFILFASETQAIRHATSKDVVVHEVWPGEVKTWTRQPSMLWN